MNKEKRLKIISDRANALFDDASTINGAICFGAKNLGLTIKDASDFLGFKRANGTNLAKKFEDNASYQDIKDLIVHCTMEIYRK